MSKKIRILLLSANPVDTSHLRLDQEARNICDRLEEGSDRDRFELITYQAARPSDLQRLLLKHRPHIVHFTGHGDVDSELILESPAGKSVKIGPQQLANLFRRLADSVRVVVLNACYTAPHASAIAEVIDYTIGTNRQIGDRAAVAFAGAFYLALAFGRPIQEAFELGKGEIDLHGLSGSDTHELFVREGVDVCETFLPPMETASQRKSKRRQQAVKSHPVTYASTEIGASTNQPLMRNIGLKHDLPEEAPNEDKAEKTEVISDIRKSSHAAINIVPSRRARDHGFTPLPSLVPTPFHRIVVEREDALVEVKRLVQSTSTLEPNINLTIVRGWPGVGKTTLVEAVGRDPEIQKVFPDGVLWTSLGLQPELIVKLTEWGRTIGTDEFSNLDEAVVKLAALIRHRRMLLIVDDVWEAAHVVPFLKTVAGSRCALLTTTRITKVAGALTTDDERIYVLPPLSEDDALTLLRHQIPSIVEQYPEECQGLVRELGCLPLAILVGGRLLKAEASMGLNIIDFINGIKEGAGLLSEPAPLNRTEGAMLPTICELLKRSTNDLDQLTRDHFASLGAFAPKPATFAVDAMRAVWEIEDPTPIIRKLVGYGLLEPIGAGRFQMDELLIKYARSMLDDLNPSSVSRTLCK